MSTNQKEVGTSLFGMNQEKATLSPRLSAILDAPMISQTRCGPDEFVDMSLEEYVRSRQGKRAISRVLIANNGIAAVKAIRSIRKFSYETFGKDDVIKFVAMATPEDIKANATYIHLADEFIAVPGGPNNNNYANVQLIVDIAERCGAHAVWAGWGHASENPTLPDSLVASASKIQWIGPPSEAMRALGDKIGSTLIAQSAGVSCMPWSGSGLTVDYANTGIPKDKYSKSCVTTVAEAEAAAEKVGFPLMIKASEGGGGKGIRKVTQKDEIAIAFGQVQGEVPGSPIFLMRMATDTRHLEVQLLADEYGDAIAIFGRDCSIQRRHQKIIEEGPVVAAPPKKWREMEKAAVRLAKEVGYVGAGTVEYLYTDENEYYFLELNPRLQVEHPVTELISGVNLPAAQLQVAMGIPLHRIRGIRLMYEKTPAGSSAIDFDNTEPRTLPGHVIACRITAENPDVGFQPTSGSIQELNFRSTPDVWGYFSVASKGGVHEYSDSQFGHMFAFGANREAARRCMSLALKELSIRGDIRTTVEYLRMILETEDFRKNHINTTWLEATMTKGLESTKPPAHVAVLLGALFQGHVSSKSRQTEYMSCLERGQLPSRDLHDHLFTCKTTLIYENVKYYFTVTRSGPDSFDASINNCTVSAIVMALSDDGILCILDGKKHVVYGHQTPAGLRLVVDSQTVIFSNEYDPSSLKATMQGKLVNYLAKSGAHLAKGDPYAEVEVMKMYITLTAPEAGVFTAVKPVGSILNAGDVIGELELDHPELVQKAEVFVGTLPAMKDPNPTGGNVNVLLSNSLSKVNMLLDGYVLGTGVCGRHVNSVMECLKNPGLPLTQFTEALSNLVGRIPQNLMEAFTDITSQYSDRLLRNRFYWEKADSFPVIDLNNAIDNSLYGLNETEKNVVLTALQVNGILELLDRYSDGNHSGAVVYLSELIQKYIDIEKIFSGNDPDQVIKELRKKNKDDLEMVARIARAHHQVKSRTQLILNLLKIIEQTMQPLLDQFEELITELSKLRGPNYSPVVLKARQILMRVEVPSASKRKIAVLTILNSVSRSKGPTKIERLEPLIDQSQPIEDIIFSFFSSRQDVIQNTAMETYIRRLCRVHAITKINISTTDGVLMGEWTFTEGSQSSGVKGKFLSSLNLVALAQEEKDQRSPRLKKSLVRASSLETENKKQHHTPREGLIAYFRDYDGLKKGMGAMVDKMAAKIVSGENDKQAIPHDVLYLVFNWTLNAPEDEQLSQYCSALIKVNEKTLESTNVGRITFLVVGAQDTEEGYPSYFTFRRQDSDHTLKEDITVRHMEPFYARYMELHRMKNFKLTFVPTPNRMVYLFAGEPNSTPKEFRRAGYGGHRLFCRVLVRKLDSATLYGYNGNEADLNANSHPETELALVEAMNSLEVAIAGNYKKWRYNNIFINVLVTTEVSVEHILDVVYMLGGRYGNQMKRLNIDQCEFSMGIKDPISQKTQRYRFFAQNPTGYSLQVQPYLELPGSDGETILEAVELEQSAKTNSWTRTESFAQVGGALHWDQKNVNVPYPVSLPLQTQRAVAHIVGTVYVYDFLLLVDKSLRKQWKKAGATPPEVLHQAIELIIDPEDRERLIEIKRDVGKNNIGMVAWRIVLYTPQYPKGREVIIIANDISFQMGTFGTEEDQLFYLASKYARAHGLPRLYFTVNSGARIGLAEEVTAKFKIAWKGEDVTNGYDYLYLTEDDYTTLADSNSIKGTPKVVNVEGKEETRYVINDVIGKKHGLGVENLSGSGKIAGETSLAYDEIFTLTYVTGRTVGIGSYLARLGQRVIQKVGHPIVLTGYNALNKLLGKSVYTSNTQLGGIDIMFTNGVTHMVVETDLQGVYSCLQWLSYVPPKRHAPLPMQLTVTDPVSREIEFQPPSSPYDCRFLLTGQQLPNGEWEKGFFDHGSFTELLGGWSKSVVVGRARLGGIPMGCIAVETRTTEAVIPADPASPDSKEQIVTKPGQVWFPDSSHKTAQGIRDMIAEDIPLIIFANWRGFSGGMNDMFFEILKFGSHIVDALREYKQPVFIYIPPLGTLRGGAWVVVDSTINPTYMEMYAAETARGGVLEPEGTVDVKFKKPHIISLMHRLDNRLISLTTQLTGLEAKLKDLQGRQSRKEKQQPTPEPHHASPHQHKKKRHHKKNHKKNNNNQQKSENNKKQTDEDALKHTIELIKQTKMEISKREQMLLPLYHTVATAFADLHDTPGRMISKGVIRGVVEWKHARTKFYWRLRRRLVELKYTREIMDNDPTIEFPEALTLLHGMLDKDLTPTYSEKVIREDRLLIDWMESHTELIETNLNEMREAKMTTQVSSLFQQNPDRFVGTVLSLLQGMAPKQREALQKAVAEATAKK